MTSLWLDEKRDIPVDSYVADATYDAVVVGAGITGLATAGLLARSGMTVALLEARSVGAGTTGNTTGKLSLLQGTVLSALRKQYPQKTVNAYVEANKEGQAWLLRYLEERSVPFQLRDAYTFAVSDDGADRVRAELAVGTAAGLASEETADAGLPFSIRSAIRLRDQAQFNPMDVLESLAADFRAHGGVLVEGVRVRDVGVGSVVSVRTDGGEIRAGHAVLATGIPILDRGLYFAKLKASQSYAAAFRVPASTPVPSGMYLSAETPGRSLRTYPGEGGELLIAGGNGHQVGREPSPQARLDELLKWTRQHFPGAEATHAWSGDTGYNKWGMSNSIAASLAISSEILGGPLPWADTLHRRAPSPQAAAAAIASTPTRPRQWRKVGRKQRRPRRSRDQPRSPGKVKAQLCGTAANPRPSPRWTVPASPRAGRFSRDPPQRTCPPRTDRLTLRLARCPGPTVSVPRQQQCQCHHSEPQNQMEPVVGVVHRNKVRRAVGGDQKAIDPEDQIDDPAVQEEALRLGGRAGHQNACHAKKKMDQIVKDGYLENSQEQGPGAVACDTQGFIVAGNAWNESQDPDQQEDGAHCLGRSLQSGFGTGRAVGVYHFSVSFLAHTPDVWLVLRGGTAGLEWPSRR